MKIAVRLIYYKPVTPSMDVIDLDDENWRRFLYGSNRERIDIACRIMDKQFIESYVRECAWIPLDDQDKLVEKS